MKALSIIIGLFINTYICVAGCSLNTKNESTLKQELITDSSINIKDKSFAELTLSRSESSKSNKVFDWNNLLSALLGGLIGLSPSIINYCRKPKINGRIISQYSNFGLTPEGEKKLMILQKVAIFSENQNFFLKDIEIFVKFPDKSEQKCRNWTWRSLTFTFDDNGKNIQKKLKIDSKEYLLHINVFPKEHAIIGYVSFSIDSVKDEMFEYIKYLFRDYKGNVKQLKIDKSEIVDSTLIFDDTIWN